MLAVSATGTLSVLDAAILKRAPSSVSSCLSLTHTATSSVWSFDNAVLFLASAQGVHRYDPISNNLKEIYALKSTDPISRIVCKDKGTLIFSMGDKIHVLECGSSARMTQTIESHKSAITSISLSNDNTLLATTTASAVHVHNLTLGSHTVLRGLAQLGQTITTSTFHPHSRTRLLIGTDKQLLVYDTTRPSGPLKSISLNETSGDIVGVACSPFSKTLVAVATSSGHVGLIDLEKEKGLFRTLNVKVPLTVVGFSAEGTALYLGTEHGKLLILDLRALDKTPKAITVSDVGCRIETMSVQRKVKGSEVNAKTPLTTVASTHKTVASSNPARKPSTQTTMSKFSKVPISPDRPLSSHVNSTLSPVRRLPSATSKESVVSSKTTPKKEPVEKKKVFSPVRDPYGNSSGDISVQIETLKGTDRNTTSTKLGKAPTVSPLRSRPSSSPKAQVLSVTSSRTVIQESSSQEGLPRRSRTVPATTRAKKSSTSTTVVEPLPSSTHLAVPTVSTLHPGERLSSRTRPRAGSSASHVGSISTSASAASVSTRPTSSESTSRPSSRLRHAVPSPPIHLNVPLPASRTPSPDLPDINLDPITPVPVVKMSGLGVLGMGSPEVDRWIHAGKDKEKESSDGKGKGKGKTVEFEGESDEEGDDDLEERERERERSMQVTPRRPSSSWQPSPVYKSPANMSAGGGTAHDLLRTIVKDVMFDFQQETRAEMTGLHLDLVRMGRGWKKELREMMQEYTGGMEELREENRRLREENERLRRGF